MRRARPPLEKHEQAQILKLLLSMGAMVYVLGTRRPRGRNCPRCGLFLEESQGTRQTPGISDLLVFLKDPHAVGGRTLVWIECKRHGGRLTEAQQTFRETCLAAQIDHVVGDLDDVIAWLIRAGYLREDQVGHYHISQNT